MRRRNVGVFCCLLCLVLACSTMMFGCGKAKQEEQKSATNQKTEKANEPEETGDDVAALLKNAKYVAVIHVKINPEFNLYLDSEGCIVYVEYLNEDAADLFETVDLTGQKLADGMETIVGAAEEKGYLTGQNEVTTDVVWVQEKLSANSVAVRMESRALFVMARV